MSNQEPRAGWRQSPGYRLGLRAARTAVAAECMNWDDDTPGHRALRFALQRIDGLFLAIEPPNGDRGGE